MNILIIDDEGRIRNMVYTQVMQMELGAERVDTAGSAEEARKRMEEYFYDIFLCDIVMPGENGIEFARWVLNQYPDVKFIFLTAYAEVEYMKSAISMHSFDYILQPVSGAELRSVLERAVAKIGIEKRNRELISRGEFFGQREDTILEARTIRYLEGKKEENGYIRRVIQKHSPYGPGECVYQPVMVQVLERQETELNENELRRLIFQNIVEEIFEPVQVRGIVLLREEDLFLILYWRSEAEIQENMIQTKLENLRLLFGDMLHLQTAIYCGKPCKPEALVESSKPLFERMKNNVRRESRLFWWDSDLSDSFSHSFDIQVNTWKKFLEDKEFESFRDSILYYIEKGPGGNRIGAQTMMQLHQKVTELVLGFLVSHQISSEKIFDEGLTYMDYMNSWTDIDCFRPALEYIIEQLIRCTGGVRQFNPVEEARLFIKQNIDADITVSEVAEHIGMNPEYCTKLFKKATGYTLKEYIVQEKMEAAKVLLQTTELPITLISSHVGYGNYSNFTRSFKQVTGMTPMEYRNSLK